MEQNNKKTSIHSQIALILSIIIIPLTFISIANESIESSETNTIGVITIFLLIGTIIFGIISLERVKKQSKKGRGNAITSIIISSILLFFIIIIDIQFMFDENSKIYLQKESERITEIDNLKNKLTEIENKKPEIITRIVNNSPNLSSIISEWTPKVGFIICSWNGSNTIASGSFTINKFNDFDGGTAVTNRHVLEDDLGFSPNECILEIDNSKFIIPGDKKNVYLLGDKEDYGLVRTNIAAKPIKVCGGGDASYSAKIGDNIVVLGYPGIGSHQSITATEGIISGIESNYYVTSAKIEHGNSGGAAILIKDDCYLGVPSYAETGKVEALGRILKSSFIFSK